MEKDLSDIAIAYYTGATFARNKEKTIERALDGHFKGSPWSDIDLEKIAGLYVYPDREIFKVDEEELIVFGITVTKTKVEFGRVRVLHGQQVWEKYPNGHMG